VRTDPENPLNTGDTAWLTLPPQRCFLFDEQGLTLP
jgi:multiple sugar transport system ATP-binding protein